MIDRWKLDTNIVEFVASVLSNPPLNGINPTYINQQGVPLPNAQLNYPIVKGRKLYECEEKNVLQIYVMSDDIKERHYNRCHFLCECYVLVGVVRMKDEYIPAFDAIKSALSIFFGASSMEYKHISLSDGNVVIPNSRFGNFGISKCEIQSTRKASDKCGVYTFEMIVKFSLYFSNFQS